MARRPSPPTPEAHTLSVEQTRFHIEQLENCIRDLEAFDPQKTQKRKGGPEVVALEAAIDGALAAAFGHGSPSYNRYKSAAVLDNGPRIGTARINAAEGRGSQVDRETQDAKDARQYPADGKDQSIALLRVAISVLKQDNADQQQFAQRFGPATGVPLKSVLSRKIFLVHGHDEGARETVARFLERIGFEAIILHEQANRGRTIIEKVVAHGDVGFAVVLLTPDDEGCKKGEAAKPRARQNVVLELGYFVGRLGRERVCALRRGDVELPSDFGGVVYEPFDEGGGWRKALGRELEAAGFEIDWVMRR